MKLLKFELKKLWKQKKFLWMLFVLTISIVGLFYNNYSMYEEKEKRALQITDTYQEDINGIRRTLEELRMKEEISPEQALQLESIVKMNSSLLPWRYAISQGEWQRVPALQKEFLQLLQEYIVYGGDFPSLQGFELERAIKKTDWLITHDIPYEDEVYPVSPHLFLLQNVSLLFGIIGLSLIILLVGNSVTIEKEQKTELTLKTQPIGKINQTLSKFGSLVVFHAVFVAGVILLSIILPLIFTEYKLVLSYPQAVVTDGVVTIIPASTFLGANVLLFLCASWFVFTLIFFISNWLKDSFTTIMNIAVVLGISFVLTGYVSVLQSPYNPFSFFVFTKDVQEEVVVYLLSTLIWGAIFLAASIYFAGKHIGLRTASNMYKPFRKGKTENESNKVRNILVFEWRKLVRKKL